MSKSNSKAKLPTNNIQNKQINQNVSLLQQETSEQKKGFKNQEEQNKNENILKNESIVDKNNNKNILEQSGILDAYEYFLKQLCKNGLPTGNVYEFAAQEILKFERKFKKEQAKQFSNMRNSNVVQKIVPVKVQQEIQQIHQQQQMQQNQQKSSSNISKQQEQLIPQQQIQQQPQQLNQSKQTKNVSKDKK